MEQQSWQQSRRHQQDQRGRGVPSTAHRTSRNPPVGNAADGNKNLVNAGIKVYKKPKNSKNVDQPGYQSDQKATSKRNRASSESKQNVV